MNNTFKFATKNLILTLIIIATTLSYKQSAAQNKKVSAFPFNDGLARIIVNKKQGYIDKTGKIIVDPQYEFARDFCAGFARIKDGDKYGYLDKTGQIAIKAQFDYADDFRHGIANVKYNGKYCYIDETGEFIYTPKI